MPLDQVGRYRVTGRPQQGRGCLRYPATDTLLGREVVLRTFPAVLSDDPALRERFLAQSRHLARLRHPNIAALLDVAEQDGRVFQVLPRESGRNLACEVRRRRPRDLGWTLRIVTGLCDGLSYVHAEGVVHGRLSPNWIFLRDDEEPVLHGFEPDASTDDPMLRVGMVVDNARYLAPEVVRKEPVDARTDLWSLGVLLFHLLSGRYPQEARDALTVMEHTASPRPCPSLAAVRADLPQAAVDLAARLLEKDPARRPASAEEVREALDAFGEVAAAPAPSDPTVRLIGRGAEMGLRRFAILERLGSGAFGVVFRATDRRTGQTVALKILRPALTEDSAAAARFRREAEAAGALSHPNVVRVLDAGRDGDASYVAMELVDGPSLAERLRTRGPLPWREAAALGEGILDALAEAHAREVVHRDLKPANILLRSDGRPVLVDFGMAHLGEGTRLTRAGDVLGTPAYMAPEQMDGRPADPRSDLYAVGAILYEALAGAPPFKGETLAELCRRVTTEAPAPLRERGVSAPADLERVVLGLLEKDPVRRLGPAGALAQELRALRA